MSNYLTTDGLKKISLLPEAPWGLRHVAFATSATWLIRHWSFAPYTCPSECACACRRWRRACHAYWRHLYSYTTPILTTVPFRLCVLFVAAQATVVCMYAWRATLCVCRHCATGGCDEQDGERRTSWSIIRRRLGNCVHGQLRQQRRRCCLSYARIRVLSNKSAV